jgi:hypothetical protein
MGRSDKLKAIRWPGSWVVRPLSGTWCWHRNEAGTFELRADVNLNCTGTLFRSSRSVLPAAPPDCHINPSDPARDTASARVLTASFEKMRLTCDFTVSGEMSKVRAMRLFAKP